MPMYIQHTPPSPNDGVRSGSVRPKFGEFENPGERFILEYMLKDRKIQ